LNKSLGSHSGLYRNWTTHRSCGWRSG